MKGGLKNTSPIDQSSNRRLFNLENLGNLRKSEQCSDDLLAPLADFWYCTGTDPRDVVYALLAVLEEQALERLTPNYSPLFSYI